MIGKGKHLKPSLLLPRKNPSDKIESMLKEFLTSLTEASYQVALKCGFRGTFIVFLSDLQEALEKVIQKDNSKFLKKSMGVIPKTQAHLHPRERRTHHVYLHS